MDPDSLENLYYAIASVVVAILTVQGWRQGVGRQATALLAIAGAYLVGYFCSAAAAPYFEFLRYPAQITRILAGAAAGLLTLVGVTVLGRVMFKRTSEQAPGKSRWIYGIFGAFLGLFFGGILFLIATEVVRLTGALIQANASLAQKTNTLGSPEPTTKIHPVITGIADLSTALNEGGSGDFFRKVDPVPPSVFATIGKLGKMLATPEAANRFLEYPGVADLARNPKILALRSDPEVMKLLASQSYFQLLRHEKIVSVANDPDLATQLKNTDFNQALDHALKPVVPQNELPPIERESARGY